MSFTSSCRPRIYPGLLAVSSIASTVAFPLIIGLCILGATRQSGAQTLYGTIVGSVTDASGAVVPDATVKATQIETNETQTVTTNAIGDYVISTIPAGSYNLSISKLGFGLFEAKGISLTISVTVRVDAKLAVGSQSVTIDVSTSTAELQTDRTEVHGVLTADDLQQLPQPTRTYQGLTGLLPGVSPPQTNAGGTNNPARSMLVSANGTSASGTNVSIDGVSATNPWVQFFSTAVPSTEAIETVSVVTASPAADEGTVNGAGISVQIKSGTDSFHGSAYWYNENNAIKAKPYFQPLGTKKPKYIDNDAGATIGGPIIRDKLFFFGSYEGDFLRQAAGGFYTLPTPDMASGILASPTPIFDPATGNADGSGRTPFAQDSAGNYIIPSYRISSISQKLIAQIPTGVANGVYSNNIFINTPFSYNLHKIDTKIDWNTTKKLRITGRFSDYPYSQTQPPAFGEILGGGYYNTDQLGNIYAISAMATFVASPRFVADIVLGLTHSTQKLLAPLSNTRYAADVLGIPNTNLGPLPSAGGVPQFNFTTGALYGFGYAYPSLIYEDPVFEYAVNATWIKGKHSIRFGIDVSQQHMNHKEVGPTQFNFTGGVTSLYCPSTSSSGCADGSPPTNQFNSWADFLLGMSQNAAVEVLNVPEYVTLRSWILAPYVSDTYQATPKLTLYAGTGWDYFPVPHRENRGVEYYDLSTNVYNLCGEASVPRNCGIAVQKTLFAPRVGLAYRVERTFVIRAGYSLAPEQINMYRDGMYNYPLLLAQFLSGTNSYTAATSLAQGFPILPNPDTGTGVVPLPPIVSINSSPKHFVRGYTESYNLSMQRELGWNLLAQIGYVGTLTIHQHTRYNANYGLPGGGTESQQLYSPFGITAAETIIEPFEHMNYNSLQAQLEKRFGNGLQFFSSYTWSKWMGLCCDEKGDNQPAIPIPAYYGRNYALMPDDRTNNFQLSAVYQLPFGRNKRYLTGGVSAALAGGWQINGVLALYSGTPFWISAPSTSLNAPGSPQLADQLKPHVRILGAHGLASPYFDTTAFAPVTAPRFGTSSFDSLRGPGYGNLDFSVFRTFGIHELNAQLRMEALNLTNHPNFSNPDNGATDPNFGLISSTYPGSRLIAERCIRLGLKLMF